MCIRDRHNTNTFYVVDCPILLVSHALTKDNQNDNIFIQCKFENTLSKIIKALYVHINCFDVTNNPLPDVDSFSYLDIEVKQYQTFGDKTPIAVSYTHLAIIEFQQPLLYCSGFYLSLIIAIY